MPITPQYQLKRIPENAFKNLDYQVMGLVFTIHNELGRFFDEKIYASLLCQSLCEEGLQASREFQLQIEHKNFKKVYYMDLLIESSIPYELKTVHSLSHAHDAQLLNYLFIADLAHGKLVNFRETSINGRYLSTSLSRKDRRKYQLHLVNWQEELNSPEIVPILTELLEDWGTHLSVELYKEALCHILGIQTHCHRMLELKHNGMKLGTTEPPMLNSETIFHLTAIRQQYKEQESHIRRLLHMSNARKVQWINFDHSHITLTTIT